MVVGRMIRYVMGSVHFTAQNGFVERLLNLCAVNTVPLWGIERTDEGFAAYCAAREYKKVCEYAGRVNVELAVLSRHGFFHRAGKYKMRWGLFIGAAACLVFLFISQFYVWDIQIQGNTTVPDSVVLNELSSIGVKKFAFIPGLDLLTKRQEALLRLPQFSWLAINKSGCRLVINVTERKMPPRIWDDTPCDIVAARTGQIRYMEVYAGKQCVEENYTVREGQLLVQGAYTGLEGGELRVHASAKIIAEVQFDKTLLLDLEQLAKKYTGKEKTRYYLNLFSLRLPLFLAVPMEGDYDTTLQQHPLVLFGQEVPIGLDTLNYRFYDKDPNALTQEQARKVLEQSFRQYEAAELKGVAILSREWREEVKDGVYSLTASYVAEQDIATPRSIAE